MSEPLYPPPPPSYPPPPTGTGYPPPPMGTGSALPQVQGPAVGLIVTGAIGLCLGIYSLISGGAAGLAGMGNLGGDQAAQYAQYLTGGIGILLAIISLGASAFIIWAALQMKQLRGWTLSVVASIVAMIPCIGPCCIIGLPIGIWSVIVLMKPEVKAAFRG